LVHLRALEMRHRQLYGNDKRLPDINTVARFLGLQRSKVYREEFRVFEMSHGNLDGRIFLLLFLFLVHNRLVAHLFREDFTSERTSQFLDYRDDLAKDLV